MSKTKTYFVSCSLVIEVPECDVPYLTGEAVDKKMQGCDDWDPIDIVNHAINNERACVDLDGAIYVYDEDGTPVREFNL